MTNINLQPRKSVISKLMIAFMFIMSVLIITPTVADAASKPQITKTSMDLLVGKKFDLNIKNQIKNSTYAWKTSDKKIATVDKNGIVKGMTKGTVTITCTIKAGKATYNVTCKVNVIKGATKVKISNKVTALNVGQIYNLDRTLYDATSNDKVNWTSSNTAIANPAYNGVFKALKTGTVTITCTTSSGVSDKVTIKIVDKYGTVTNQAELDKLLGSGAKFITIKTTDAVNFNIAAGDYKTQNLVVDAPNADVTNAGQFAAITIKAIKASTWREKAVGNLLRILATDSRIVIDPNAKVSIVVTAEGAKLVVENNGVVEELAVQTEADIEVSGESDQEIPVVVNVPGITIKTSVPLDLDCKAKVKLEIQPGAEATTIHADSEAVIPTIIGEVTLTVTVGTGTNTTTKEVTGTKEEPTGGTPGGIPGGNPGGGTTSQDYSITSWSGLSSITVTYGGQSYSVSGLTLTLVKSFLNATPATITSWQNTTNETHTYDGVTVQVTGTLGSNTKTVKLTGGNFGTTGRTYQITINPTANSVTITSQSNITFTVTYVNATTMRISPVPTGLTFTVN